LLALGGGGINLRALLAVAEQDEVDNTSDSQTLSVFSRKKNECLSVSPGSVAPFPSEQVGDYRLLPRLKYKRFSSKLSLDVR
jgi:hypothetical protein